MWKEFELEKITTVSTPKKRFNANTLVIHRNCKQGFPYVVRTSLNNGIRGYIKEDEKFLNNGNTFSFGQDTATVFWQPEPYFTGDKIKILTPRQAFTNEIALFVLVAIRKAFSLFAWGTDSFNEEIIKSVKILLPIKTAENNPVLDETCYYHNNGYIPDFDYMHECILKVEYDYVLQLERCLDELDISNCILQENDLQILNRTQITKTFVMRDLFKKVKAPYKGKGKKQDNVSKNQTEEFCLPLINCKDGNNGIMYYGRKADFTVHNNVLSIIYNGPPTEGQTYYQDEIGLYTDAYLVDLKCDKNINRELGLYLTTAINKSIHNLEQKKYSRGNKATWNNKVEYDEIILPVQTDTEDNPIIDMNYSYHSEGYIPDWEYMSTYIRVIEKIVIENTIKFKDKMITNLKMMQLN